MPILLSKPESHFLLHPEGGPFPAVLSKIREHKGVETAYGVKDRLQLDFQTSELQSHHVEGVTDDRPMVISEFVNSTLNEKSKLMGLISQQIASEELKSRLSIGAEINIEDLLIRTQWILSVVHNEANGRTYANIAHAMKAPPEQKISIWGKDGL